MALQFCDSFDHYTTMAQMGLKWHFAAAASLSAGNGRNGTNSFRYTSNAQQWARRDLVASVVTAGCGASFKMTGLSTTTIDLYTWADSALSVQLMLSISSAGHLQVHRGTAFYGTLLGTGTKTFLNGETNYVEMKVTIDPAAGTVGVKVNGITDINLSGINTRGSAITSVASIYLGQHTNNGGTVVVDADDFVLWDTTGAQNNDFMGDVRVQCLFPNAAGATSAWTPNSAVANYTTVDEATPNDDTDYNYSATAGQVDTYNVTDLAPSSGTVKAVQTVPYARKDDAGVRTVAPVIRHGGVDYVGTSHNVGNTYVFLPDVTELNPGTGVAFTVADVNGDEFGVKMVA